QAVQNPAQLATMGAYFTSLGINISDVFGALQKTNGNTDFEQLGCIGLDEGAGSPDALVGTLTIKLPSGYLGNPCAAGSKEYVAFWIDWGHGWQWQGTVSLPGYAIPAIPKGGLTCAAGEAEPVSAPVRALLSWAPAPPAAIANYVPLWGNRLETLILFNPGQS